MSLRTRTRTTARQIILIAHVNLFIHSFILETYIAPLQETTTQRRNGVQCVQRSMVNVPKFHSLDIIFINVSCPYFFYLFISSSFTRMLTYSKLKYIPVIN